MWSGYGAIAGVWSGSPGGSSAKIDYYVIANQAQATARTLLKAHKLREDGMAWKQCGWQERRPGAVKSIFLHWAPRLGRPRSDSESLEKMDGSPDRS
jgi:hypothetical protein